MSEDFVLEEDNPLSPSSVAMILNNLFRKESNGDPIDFYLRRSRLRSRQSDEDLITKLEKLKTVIEECGGCLMEEPSSCFSIELVFPEFVDIEKDVEADLFDARFVEECVRNQELLDLENFRVGNSPYDESININDIMKGLVSWDSVRRPSPQKGRKLPDFGLPIESSLKSTKNLAGGKRSRVEYTTEEDTAMLKFLLRSNLYNKTGGNTTWMIVHREFPSHSYQSLKNRFRRVILPNIERYRALTESEKKLFSRSYSCDKRINTPVKNIPTDGSDEEVHVSQTERYQVDETILNSSVTTISDGATEEEVPSPGVASLDVLTIEQNQSTSAGAIGCGSPSKLATTSSTCERLREMDTNVDNLQNPKRSIVSERKTANEKTLKPKTFYKQCISSSSVSSVQDSDSSLSEASGDTDKETSKLIKKKVRLYTFREDKIIIDYIVDHGRYEEVRGKILWVDIQNTVLKKYKRSWESAKNRFLKTLFKELSKFNLSEDIINKFRRGAVAERHLGGAGTRKERKRKRKNKNSSTLAVESTEEVPAKHPALATRRQITPCKVEKRQLFRQPVVPLPLVFSPLPIPMAPGSMEKSKGRSKQKLFATPEQEKLPVNPPDTLDTGAQAEVLLPSADTTKAGVLMSPTDLAPPKPLPPSPVIKCSVVVKRLNQADLEKYGCKTLLPQRKLCSISTRSVVEIPLPLLSQFNVEISPSLIAARLSSSLTPTKGLNTKEPPGSKDSPKAPPSPFRRQSLSAFRQSTVDREISNEGSPVQKNLTTMLACRLNDEISSDGDYHSVTNTDGYHTPESF